MGAAFLLEQHRRRGSDGSTELPIPVSRQGCVKARSLQAAFVGGLFLLADCTGSPSVTTASPGASVTTLGRPPEKIEANFYVCPLGFDFAAYGRTFHLPNDPFAPTEATRPDRCFSRGGPQSWLPRRPSPSGCACDRRGVPRSS